VPKKKVAVILAGAVAKGAYAAGALQVLAQQGLEVTRIVGTSSGALNGALYASYVRRGIEQQGVAALLDLWSRSATVMKVLAFELASALRLEGLSSMAKVRDLLLPGLGPEPMGEPRPISLRIITSPLGGIASERLDALARKDDLDPLPAPRNRTTHEHVCDFTAADFDTREGRERIVTAALASSAFPFAFLPIAIEDPDLGPLGACIDGGAANNTPIKWALGGEVGDALDAIVVISPTVEARKHPPGPLRGVRLLEHVITMLVNERLYRDLREAERVNAQLERLAALRASNTLSQEQHRRVLEALGWGTMRTIRVLAIRPDEDLDGNSFLGFGNARLRRAYIERGIRDAEAVFDAPEHRWLAEP
jgi:NTE family protein